MEQYCEPGKIHVTDRFRDAVILQNPPGEARDTDAVDAISFTCRDKIDIKGKGIMQTWWME
jgi:hypothetical protein